MKIFDVVQMHDHVLLSNGDKNESSREGGEKSKIPFFFDNAGLYVLQMVYVLIMF